MSRCRVEMEIDERWAGKLLFLHRVLRLYLMGQRVCCLQWWTREPTFSRNPGATSPSWQWGRGMAALNFLSTFYQKQLSCGIWFGYRTRAAVLYQSLSTSLPWNSLRAHFQLQLDEALSLTLIFLVFLYLLASPCLEKCSCHPPYFILQQKEKWSRFLFFSVTMTT